MLARVSRRSRVSRAFSSTSEASWRHLERRGVEICALLDASGQTVSVAEWTSGGLIAASLWTSPIAHIVFRGAGVAFKARCRRPPPARRLGRLGGVITSGRLRAWVARAAARTSLQVAQLGHQPLHVRVDGEARGQRLTWLGLGLVLGLGLGEGDGDG